jgi:hypothetical protein
MANPKNSAGVLILGFRSYMAHQLAVDSVHANDHYLLYSAVGHFLRFIAAKYFFSFLFFCQSKLDKLNSCCIVPKVSFGFSISVGTGSVAIGTLVLYPVMRHVNLNWSRSN